jgi:hypothetical protein
MRQLRVNAALLAFALAPLIYGLCANIVTGGSFAAALDSRNLWVFPFLIASGATFFIYNYMQATALRGKGPPDKRVEGLITTVPAVDKVVRRRALAIGSHSTEQNSQFSGHRQEAAAVDYAETVEALVTDLFAQTDEEFSSVNCRAAWRLAALMGSSNVRAALSTHKLTDSQLSQPRLRWLIRSTEGSASPNYSLNVVNGRIGYLIRKSGLLYLPPPPLVVDPYIAVALIVVREDKISYHSGCPVDPHGNDVNILDQLYHAGQSATGKERASGDADAFRSYLEGLTYHDIGKLIRPELPHTNPDLAAKQARLVSHVMRHFLDDELSAVLFDALSPENQIHLAMVMLTASQWMSPTDWQHWAKTGRDLPYASRLEAASDLSFAAACGMAIGIVVIACWQIVAWVSYGWSWYFGSHLLAMWHGWFKALFIVAAIVFCIMGLFRSVTLGPVVAITGGIGLLVAILASPVVRLHIWVSSWAISLTIILSALIASAVLVWLGILYSDRRYTKEPVQLGSVARGRSSEISPRSRFHPSHQVGHDQWCTISGRL